MTGSTTAFTARRMLVSGRLADDVAAGLAQELPDLATRIAAEEPLSADDAAWADSYAGFDVPPGLADSGVRWVHSMAAGVEGIVPALADLPPGRDMVLTRTVGQMPRTMGQYVLAHLLAHLLRLPEYAAQQARARWEQLDPPRTDGLTVGVLGTGEIGAGVSAVLRANGFRTVGMSSRGAADPDFDDVVPLADAGTHLGRCAALVCALPLTEATQGLVDAALLARLDGAVVVNVGRGQTLVAADLRSALDDGHVRRAVLDVFETEPLPAEDWRWNHPGVTVTPHVAARTDADDVVAALVPARTALAEGRRPPLAVDLARGY